MQPDTDLIEVSFSEDGNRFTCYARSDDTDQEPVFWRRKDYPDVVYRTEDAKLRAVTTEILRRHILGQPMLVGTTSVELSERLSSRLRADALQTLMNIMVLREAYLEAQGLSDEGMRIAELDPLNTPLIDMAPTILRPMAQELGITLNPTKPENLASILSILELDVDHAEALEATLKSGIKHNVLNAKKHDEESAIIAWAGSKGAVTIATNMAGRGVDIKLGGEIAEEILAGVYRVLRRLGIEDPENLSVEERLEALEQADEEAIGIYGSEIAQLRNFMEDGQRVREAGGLHVIGSERHDSRRIDNQLRGRAARQGDPGSSQFFLSLEDELMRLFGGSQVASLMQRLNIDDAVPIAHNIVNRTIEQAQTRVEGANFDTRKHLLDYDDVLNQQREVFYSQRDRIFIKSDLSQDLNEMLKAVVEEHVAAAMTDPEGPWKLLAYLEETQPTLGLESDHPHPSFMVALLLDQLEGIEAPQQVKTALLDIGLRSLQANKVHLLRTVDEQLARAIERLEDQIGGRVDTAEMAVEAAIMEAEETGATVDPHQMLSVVEQAAGLRIQMEDQGLNAIREDPHRFLRRIPELVEASMGLRVWAGLVQAVERRVGQSLGLQPSISGDLDWDQSSSDLQEALISAWDGRTEALLKEIESDLDLALEGTDTLSERDKLRLLVQMSYGQRSFFDRKTHQRQSILVSRLAYPYFVAELIADHDPDELTQAILDHLDKAHTTLEVALGQPEFQRQASTTLDQLEERTRDHLRNTLGAPLYDSLSKDSTLQDQPQDHQQQIARALGNQLLTRTYRELFLSVADREWVEYLTEMEALRTSIGLEAYGQRDPLVQYKSRAFDLFGTLFTAIRAGVVSRMFRLRAAAPASAGMGVAPAQGDAVSGSGSGTPAKTSKRKRRRKRR